MGLVVVKVGKQYEPSLNALKMYTGTLTLSND